MTVLQKVWTLNGFGVARGRIPSPPPSGARSTLAIDFFLPTKQQKYNTLKKITAKIEIGPNH